MSTSNLKNTTAKLHKPINFSKSATHWKNILTARYQDKAKQTIIQSALSEAITLTESLPDSDTQVALNTCLTSIQPLVNELLTSKTEEVNAAREIFNGLNTGKDQHVKADQATYRIALQVLHEAEGGMTVEKLREAVKGGFVEALNREIRQMTVPEGAEGTVDEPKVRGGPSVVIQKGLPQEAGALSPAATPKEAGTTRVLGGVDNPVEKEQDAATNIHQLTDDLFFSPHDPADFLETAGATQSALAGINERADVLEAESRKDSRPDLEPKNLPASETSEKKGPRMLSRRRLGQKGVAVPINKSKKLAKSGSENVKERKVGKRFVEDEYSSNTESIKAVPTRKLVTTRKALQSEVDGRVKTKPKASNAGKSNTIKGRNGEIYKSDEQITDSDADADDSDTVALKSITTSKRAKEPSKSEQLDQVSQIANSESDRGNRSNGLKSHSGLKRGGEDDEDGGEKQPARKRLGVKSRDVGMFE